jgi:hypothetical protein
MTVSYNISLPFSFNLYGGITTTTDTQKVWQDRVTIAIMTYIEESVMRPSYGTKTRAAAFENPDAAISLIEAEVSAGFNLLLPELQFLSVDASVDPLDNYLITTINYTYGSNPPESVIIKTAFLNQSGDIISEA